MKILVLITGLLLSVSVMAETSQLNLDLLLAKRGDVSAQFSVATAYEFGGDLKKDLKKSFEWYMKAANQSHAPSQYKVGYFYENGFGVAKNINTAMTWYNKAKANGSNQAKKRLNKKGFAKNEKAAKAKRLILQAKIEKEDIARKAKIAADKKKVTKQRADAKKKAQLAAKKKATKEATKKNVIPKKVVKTKKVVIAKKKQAKVRIPNMMKVILSNKWKNKHGAADYLPSASTTCLESADDELTCFSSEKSRKLNGAKVAYTAKSTIVDFKSNGSFKVIYNYNAIDVTGAKSKTVGPYGLKMDKGWQEPAIAVKCQASDRKNLTCYRGSKKVKFRR